MADQRLPDINAYVNELPFDVGVQDQLYDAFYSKNPVASLEAIKGVPAKVKQSLFDIRIKADKGESYDLEDISRAIETRKPVEGKEPVKVPAKAKEGIAEQGIPKAQWTGPGEALRERAFKQTAAIPVVSKSPKVSVSPFAKKEELAVDEFGRTVKPKSSKEILSPKLAFFSKAPVKETAKIEPAKKAAPTPEKQQTKAVIEEADKPILSTDIKDYSIGAGLAEKYPNLFVPVTKQVDPASLTATETYEAWKEVGANLMARALGVPVGKVKKDVSEIVGAQFLDEAAKTAPELFDFMSSPGGLGYTAAGVTAGKVKQLKQLFNAIIATDLGAMFSDEMKKAVAEPTERNVAQAAKALGFLVLGVKDQIKPVESIPKQTKKATPEIEPPTLEAKFEVVGKEKPSPGGEQKPSEAKPEVKTFSTPSGKSITDLTQNPPQGYKAGVDYYPETERITKEYEDFIKKIAEDNQRKLDEKKATASQPRQTVPPPVIAKETATAAPPLTDKEPVKPLWEMDLAELGKLDKNLVKEEENSLISAFGKEGAKKYKRLQKESGSMDKAKADKAAKEIESMESALTDEQRDRIYGVELDYYPEEVKEYVKSLNNLDFSSEEALAFDLKWAFSDVGEKKSPDLMTSKEQRAWATIRYAMEKAKGEGLDLEKVVKSSLEGAASRFTDPEDAAFILRRFMKKTPKEGDAPKPSKKTEATKALLAAPVTPPPPTKPIPTVKLEKPVEAKPAAKPKASPKKKAEPKPVTVKTTVEPVKRTTLAPVETNPSSSNLEAVYQDLWKKVQAGETREKGYDSEILKIAKEARDRGGLKDYGEFRKFQQDYKDLAMVRASERNKKRWDLADKYSPVKKAEPKPAAEKKTAPPPTVKPSVKEQPKATEPETSEVKGPVYTGDRGKASVGSLASDYKARGLGRSRSWSQFVIDRSLKPEMNAKEFYKYWDAAESKLLKDKPKEKAEAPRNAEPDPEYVDYGKKVRVTTKIGKNTEVREGTVERTLKGSSGDPLYEVKFEGDDFSVRVPGKDKVEFVGTETKTEKQTAPPPTAAKKISTIDIEEVGRSSEGEIELSYGKKRYQAVPMLSGRGYRIYDMESGNKVGEAKGTTDAAEALAEVLSGE
jgi:hypothetical protein